MCAPEKLQDAKIINEDLLRNRARESGAAASLFSYDSFFRKQAKIKADSLAQLFRNHQRRLHEPKAERLGRR
jgi:hypothetical protein